MRKQLMARMAVLATLAGMALVAAPASPAHANHLLYRMSASSAANGASPKSAAVSCNAGDDLLSVGGRINNGSGDVLLTRAIADAALTTGTAWGIEAIPTAAAWSIEVMIVCAPAGTFTGLNLQTTTIGPSVADKSALASCLAGDLVFGSGFYLDNANGTVAIDEVRYGTNLDYVFVQSYDYVAPPSYSLTAQAICGDPAATHYRESFFSANNAFSPKTQTTNACVSSDVSSVGGAITGGLGSVSLSTLNPPPLLATGQTTATEIGPYPNNWIVEAQAICVDN